MEQQKKMVQILMSTYNGENYLSQQLDSILNQTYSNIKILIRDDGSKDSTLKILEKYAKKYKNITYIKGNHCGAAESFFQLLQRADKEMDYYALSDQDDVWKVDKIDRALKWLKRQKVKNSNQPVMYCSALEVVDQDLNFLYKEGVERRTGDLSFGNAMVENCCTGCTMVINRALQEIIAKTRIPKCSMHDWWIYLVASYFGKVIYDPNPSIYYRQHKNNVIGMETSKVKKLKKKIKGFILGRNVISYQLMEFSRIYHLRGENGKILKQFLYAKKHPAYRLRLVMEDKIYRQSFINNLICKILILTGSM